MSVNAPKSPQFLRWRRRLARQIIILALCLIGVVWLRSRML
jgi:hypothetical protein